LLDACLYSKKKKVRYLPKEQSSTIYGNWLMVVQDRRVLKIVLPLMLRHGTYITWI